MGLMKSRRIVQRRWVHVLVSLCPFDSGRGLVLVRKLSAPHIFRTDTCGAFGSIGS
jgi:hypothetical protein